MRKGTSLNPDVALMREEKMEKIRSERQAKADENAARFNVGDAVTVASLSGKTSQLGEVMRKTKTKIYVRCGNKTFSFNLHDLIGLSAFGSKQKLERAA